MAHQTHYEVHVKQNGRWEIHARHSAGEKELAIDEAKSMDAMKHIQAVKVIQEIFDPEEGGIPTAIYDDPVWDNSGTKVAVTKVIVSDESWQIATFPLQE